MIKNEVLNIGDWFTSASFSETGQATYLSPFVFKIEYLEISQAVRQRVFIISNDMTGPVIGGSPCHPTGRHVE